jgi:hypothetical protein
MMLFALEEGLCLATNELRRFRLVSIGWTVLAINAVGLGLVSLRYLLPSVPPVDLPNFRIRHDWLVAHASLSSFCAHRRTVAISCRDESRWLVAHRLLGECTAVP